MAALVLAVVAVLGAVALATSRDRRSPTGIEQARALTEDGDGFDSEREAAQTLLRVSDLLASEAERCERGPTDRRGPEGCRPLFAAAGYARVASVRVVGCNRPELFDVRVALDRHLATLATSPEDAVVPSPPRCE